jgi:uncharacterized protein (DUF58 family)
MSEMDLGKYLNPQVVSTIKRLDLQAKCIIEGFISGRHRSPFQGFSSQFSEHRRYHHGDPIKDIDWNVYAKTEKHFIKKYEAETDLDCYLCVDTSSSMNYKHKNSNVSKLDYAIYLSAALAYMIIKQQDNVGLVTFDNTVTQYHRPKSTLKQLAQIITALEDTTQSKASDFTLALPQILKLFKHKGLIILFSDFLGDTEAALKSLAMMRGKKHDIIVFHVLDQAEIDLPFDDLTEFVDIENTATTVTAKAGDIRDQYKKEIQNFTQYLQNECENMGVSYLQLSTTEPFDKALEQFLLKRKRCF